MEYLLKLLVQHAGLSPTHYWHLRLLCAIVPGPLLGILYLLFFDKRARPRPRAGVGPTMWVTSEGRLLHTPRP
jgi:hypothetical protein